jgi:L-ascorbate metabolism protein UlaG (beta-lactamase superfamily)
VALVRFVGHATVLFELDGVRLLTDPLLRRRVAHLRRVTPIQMDDLRRPDAVLLSHAHYDHLDVSSLRLLDRTALAVVPKGLGPFLRRLGFERVAELEAGDEVDVGGVTVRATKADHDSERVFGVRTEALGFALLGSRRAFFAGDTDLFPELEGLVEDLDVALLPIWGWGAKLGRGRHLDPEKAAEAVRLLQPRVAIPIHWGTYAPVHRTLFGMPAFATSPAAAFELAVRGRAPGVDVRILAPGESLEL